MKKNAYEVLGISRGTKPEDIKKIYKTLAKKYHPDRYRNEEDKKIAEEKMKEINAAFDELSCPKNNNVYSSKYNNQDSYARKWQTSYTSNAESEAERIKKEKMKFISLLNAAERHFEKSNDKVKGFLKRKRYKKALRYLDKRDNYKNKMHFSWFLEEDISDFGAEKTITHNYYRAKAYDGLKDPFKAHYYYKKVLDIISYAVYEDKIRIELDIKKVKNECDSCCKYVQEKIEDIDYISLIFEEGNIEECKRKLFRYKKQMKNFPAEYYTLRTQIYMHENNPKKAYESFSKAMQIKYYEKGPKEPEFIDLLEKYHKRQELKNKIKKVIFVALIIIFTFIFLPLLLIISLIVFIYSLVKHNSREDILYSWIVPFIIIPAILFAFFNAEHIE